MLSSLIAEGLAMGHSCARPVPENCRNNPRITVVKTNMHYRLSLCSNNPNCLPSRPEEWLECSDVCEVCRSLTGSQGRSLVPESKSQKLNVHSVWPLKLYTGCANNNACEEQVDAYLNSYCASATASTTTINGGPTTTVTLIEAALTLTQTETITSTSRTTVTDTREAAATVTVTSTCVLSAPGSQCSALASTNSNAELLAQSNSNHKSVLALGALLALSVVVLLVVTVGWVCTCFAVKKKDRTKTLEQLRWAKEWKYLWPLDIR